MNSSFAFTDYKSYLRDLTQGPSAKRGRQAELAKAMGCQAAYLSQVLRGKSDLTEEHGIRLVRHLGLDDRESEYFFTLLRKDRASTPELVEYLEEKRKKLLREASDLKNRVDAEPIEFDAETLAAYFASWVPSTIHVATSSKRYQDVGALAARLGLPETTILETLKFLERLNLVRRERDRWIHSGPSIHLPKESPFNHAQQFAHRQQVLRSLAVKDKESLHFTSTFTLDEKDFATLRKALVVTIHSLQKNIHASGTEEIYGLSADLFRVV